MSNGIREAIVAPLGLPDRCGEDIRYDQVYARIQEAARSDREDLALGVWERELKKSDWPAVVELCIDVLCHRSKDLQVAAWLAEAWLHTEGPEGVADGLEVFVELASTYWDDIHPRPHDGDIDLRLRPCIWLAGCFEQWVLGLAAANATGQNDVPALSAGQQIDVLDRFEREWSRLEEILVRRLGDAAPAFSSLREIISARRANLRFAMGSAEPAEPGARSMAGGAQDIGSREAAYGALREIAAYLSRAEPHSPAPMIMQALVAWRDCSFQELLEKLPDGAMYELNKLFRQG